MRGVTLENESMEGAIRTDDQEESEMISEPMIWIDSWHGGHCELEENPEVDITSESRSVHEEEGDEDTESVGFMPSLEIEELSEEIDVTETNSNHHIPCQTKGVNVEPEITFERIREAQLEDETMSSILKKKEKGGKRPPWTDISMLSAATKTYWGQWELLAIKKGVLVKRWESDDGKVIRWLTALPRSLRTMVLYELHSSKTAGHLGRNKTLPKLKERYYWAGMGVDLRAFLRVSSAHRRKAHNGDIGHLCSSMESEPCWSV